MSTESAIIIQARRALANGSDIDLRLPKYLTVKRRIDFSDTLRVLGVNPDSLPTIEKILRQEENVRKDGIELRVK